MNKSLKSIITAAIIVLVVAGFYVYLNGSQNTETKLYKDTPAQTAAATETKDTKKPAYFDISEIPDYTGVKSYTVNGGNPFFTDDEISYAAKNGSYESYGELDFLGRCSAAEGNLSTQTMPADGEKRQSIREIKPSGWKQEFYSCVDSEAVVNRTHLIGWLLSAENANANNLITGTRYMNADTMTTFEIATARYIENGTARHVLYRVTPVFEGNNLMASGVLMEGLSLDDGGNSIRFCEYLYNVQPGIEFDYETGENWYTGIFMDIDSSAVITDGIELEEFILDGTTIHAPDCTDTASDVRFKGDVSMIDSWSALGYTLCRCAA